MLPPPDVYRNLAAEESLLNQGDPFPRLLLWQSPQAVVLGKNQNPWKECHLPTLFEKQIKLARRVSGGGTVYHDPGNLNVCWAMDRSQYDPNAPVSFLIRVLAQFGLEATSGKGGSVWVQGKKVSGSAFAYRRERVLHHSTLLIDADLKLLRAVLSPPRIRVETHAVSSVPAPVVNLATLNSSCTVQSLAEAMWEEAATGEGRPAEIPEFLDVSGMRTWKWIWGQTPTFRIPNLNVGSQTGELEVRKGHLSALTTTETHKLDPVYPFTRKGLREAERIWGLPPGRLERSLQEQGWWIPPVEGPGNGEPDGL